MRRVERVGADGNPVTMLEPTTIINPDKVRTRYARERTKRMRGEGSAQYIRPEGQYERFDDDPYAGPPPDREAIDELLDVLVVGGGFGGLMSGAYLRKLGIESFRIVDTAGDFGGTWYWNRYPGVRCDVESYIYFPFLEETGYIPKERYSTGLEIFAYCQQLGRHFQLYDRAVFQVRVTRMRWNDAEKRWHVSTNRGDQFKTRFVMTQSGIFTRPKLPGIPDIEEFTGESFHTSRWNYHYTGGSSADRLDRLHDKVVGIVGSGATALQCVPPLADGARHLYVFQRTPTSVAPRDNAKTNESWFKSLKPGWQQERIENFTRITSGEAVPEVLIADGWSNYNLYVQRRVQEFLPDERSPESLERVVELADFEWNEMLREYVDSVVDDPDVAADLKAYYRFMCKRPGFSDEYLQTFNRPNVTLVETSQAPIERATSDGLVIGGREYKLDCLIHATGFQISNSWTERAGYDVVGREGIRLSEKWREGAETFHGLLSSGFPNILFMGLTQTGGTVNVPHQLQQQVVHSTFLIAHCLQHELVSLEATPEAEKSWGAIVREKHEPFRRFQLECTPGYMNNEGAPESRQGSYGALYLPAGEFFDLLVNWRSDGEFCGVVLQPGGPTALRGANMNGVEHGS